MPRNASGADSMKDVSQRLVEAERERDRLRFRVRYGVWPPVGLPPSEWLKHDQKWPKDMNALERLQVENEVLREEVMMLMRGNQSDEIIPAVIVSALDFGARFSASLYSLPPGHQVHLARDLSTAVQAALDELERLRPGSLGKSASHG